MLQGHVIDPAELLSARLEGQHLHLHFRNGETIQLHCNNTAESRQLLHAVGLTPAAPNPSHQPS